MLKSNRQLYIEAINVVGEKEEKNARERTNLESLISVLNKTSLKKILFHCQKLKHMPYSYIFF